MNKRTIKRNGESNITLEQAKELFLQAKRAKGLTDNSIDNFNIVYKLFLRDNELTDNDLIDVITNELIYNWIDVMKSKDLKPESINSYLSQMRTFTHYLMDYHELEPVSIQLIRYQEEEIKYYTDDELRILLKKPDNKCSFTEYRTWVIVCFILSTGARGSTISNIHMDDIDLKSKEVRYRHLKNKHFAVIPLTNSICNILNEYLRTWDLHNSEYLFCDVAEGQLTVSAIRQAFKKYCKNRKVKQLSPHALRNSFARGWIKNGGGVFQLQQMLTHSDLTMTRRYVKLFSEDLREDVTNFTPLDKLRQSNIHTVKKY